MSLLFRITCALWGHVPGDLDWYWDGTNHFVRRCVRCGVELEG